MFNAKNFPSEDYYDYIIVGGGTAGCPLAATLSQSYRVLVLERGGVPYGNPNLMTQERFLATLTEVDTFDSHAQAEDGVPNPRGRPQTKSVNETNPRDVLRVDRSFFSEKSTH